MTFAKGKSGNPSGRAKGVLNKRTQLVALLDPHAESLIARLVELAQGGDVAALKLCMDRILPVPKIKQEPTGIELPVNMTEKNKAKFKSDLLHAVIDGKMTADEAEKIMKLVDSTYGKQISTATVNFKGMTSVEAAKVYQEIMQKS